MANSPEERLSSWTITFGRGCRHRLDVAPFSLWNTESQDYIYPTEDQVTWIFKNYNPSRIEWWSGYGFLTIFTDMPSLLGHAGSVTLTLASAPVIFVSRAAQATFITGPPLPNKMIYCYRNMLDPLPRFNTRPWAGPSMQDAQMVLNYLGPFCNVHALNFILSVSLYVELADDGRQYEPGSLPDLLGGWVTLYHHDGGDDSFWKDAKPMVQKLTVENDQVGLPRQGNGIYSGIRFVQTKDPTASITSLTDLRPSFIYFGLGTTSGYSV
jgi:hypothetical protein